MKNQVDLGGQRADGGIEVTDRRLGEGSCGGAPLSEAFFIVVRKRPTRCFSSNILSTSSRLKRYLIANRKVA